jgi:glutaredoxin
MAELTVYTRAWCPHCLRTLAFLIQSGIPYRELSLTYAPELSAGLIERFGDDRVPLIEWAGERLTDHEEIRKRWARGDFNLAPGPRNEAPEPVRSRLNVFSLDPQLPLGRSAGRGTRP